MNPWGICPLLILPPRWRGFPCPLINHQEIAGTSTLRRPQQRGLYKLTVSIETLKGCAVSLCFIFFGAINTMPD